MSNNTRPLRVLMIHGYRQNASSCREKSGAFRKLTKRHIDPVFISAPLVVPSKPDEANSADERGWWFSGADDSFSAGQQSELCRGFEASLATVRAAALEHAPIDGVLGFSQGAALVGLLCALQQRGELDWTFRFAILVAGFRSRSMPHAKLYEESITLPTLHVFGDTDRVIPKEMSEDLLKCYTDAAVLNHSGGHHIPATSKDKGVYLEFLDRMRLQC
ncbi:esterase OVCA2-like isoform X2 [Pollicipes pollicipes]|uniref:esterase OVCA2-like isoform X2 n=1 Tax=Pollicipes pollicipes TaxID=41117 RepID=UPI001885A3D3|nr:esterase OVCA2-like isoform X2 [Pollicipes pollicipes]